jgi:hypothetical protein
MEVAHLQAYPFDRNYWGLTPIVWRTTLRAWQEWDAMVWI